MNTISFNLNRRARVRLTPDGKRVYREFYQVKRAPSVVETELHSIMNIFGACLVPWNACLPFVDNEIEIENLDGDLNGQLSKSKQEGK